MPLKHGPCFRIFLLVPALFLPAAAFAAQNGNSAPVHGMVTDPTGAVIPGATVHLTNPVSGLDRTVTTDPTGAFEIPNVPFNKYAVEVSASGFAPLRQSVDIHSVVATNLSLVLQIAAASQTVTVEADAAGDLVENDPTFHTDVDRDLFTKVPLESQSSSLSSLVTATTPGVSSDSNGLFHGMGDHASNSFSVDGQSITDQQSKVFSNQIPLGAIHGRAAYSSASELYILQMNEFCK